MSKLPELVDAICEAFVFDYETASPELAKGGATFCNFGVQYVAEKMGCESLKGLTANQMCQEFVSRPTEWLGVDPQVAQYHACSGCLTIAAWQSPDPQGHGHVAIVRPGRPSTSTKWGSVEVPKVLSIKRKGEHRIAEGANWSFKEMPKFFVWVPSMEEEKSAKFS